MVASQKFHLEIALTEMKTEIRKIWDILAQVCDPEVPVLSVLDLGLVRDVSIDDEQINISISPTYSGCPAMDMISMDIRFRLSENGYTKVNIKQVLSPAWTTEWMSEAGKQKLVEYGIAAPHSIAYLERLEKAGMEIPVQCPHCKSPNTALVSQFGSTACKSLYRCLECKEPFDYFKCH